jgi:ribosomal protein L16 Arg81 hydroxylase
MKPANANLSLVANEASEPCSPSTSFHENTSFQSLMSPVPLEEFQARYWERKPLIVHRGQPGYYGDLFTLEDFDASVGRQNRYVKTAEASSKKTAQHHGTGASAMERILSDMREGHTLILDAVHQHNPKLVQMCQMLTAETGFLFQTNIYLTPPNGKGFTPHWDNHDVFIMQVLGSKHWKVEQTRRCLPMKNANIEEEGREMRGEFHEFTLQQGDTCYIPRGVVHAAECGAEPSMHITLGIHPTTFDELLFSAIKLLVNADEELRLSLPIGYHKGDGAGIVSRLESALRRTVDPAFLAQVLDRYRDESVQRAQLDVSGQIASFFKPKPLSLDDKVGARPGLLYTLRPHDAFVTLNVGTRTITFPDFFGEALKFALGKPSFVVRELPGDIEDDERLVFVERLMQEALVVRV